MYIYERSPDARVKALLYFLKYLGISVSITRYEQDMYLGRQLAYLHTKHPRSFDWHMYKI